MADNVAKFTGRDQTGRFLPGSGGRPKGARGKSSRQTLEQVKAMGGDALQALWEAVQSKERWAVEFVLGKILPTGRTTEFEGTTPEDVSEALKCGDISASEAKDISAALSKLAEIEQITELRDRIANLEALTNAK